MTKLLVDGVSAKTTRARQELRVVAHPSSIGLSARSLRLLAPHAAALRQKIRTHQLSLDPVDEKTRRIEAVADRARAKFGPRAVLPGSLAA